MKSILLSLLLSVLSLSGSFAQAPQFSWAYCDSLDYTLNPTMVLYGVESNGNHVLQTGYEKVVTLYSNYGMGNVMLRLTDLSGNIIQEEIFPGKGRVIAMDALNGGWVLIMEFLDSLEIFGNLYTHPHLTGKGQIAIALDQNLNQKWIWHPSASSPNIQALDIAADHQGGFWVSFQDGFDQNMMRFDSLYTMTDSLSILDAGWFSEIMPMDDGGMYLAGSCAGPYMGFPDTTIYISLSYNTYIARFDDDMNLLWIKFFRDITCSDPNLAPAPDGGAYFAVTLWDSLTVDSFFLNGPSWLSDFMLLRIDTSGNVLWAKETPEVLSRVELSHGEYLDSDEQGNIYIAGSSRGSIDWGNGVVTSGQPTLTRLWLLSVDPAGNARWTKSAGSGYVNMIHAISVNQQDEIVMTGNVGDSSYFGSQLLFCDSPFIPFLAMLSSPTNSSNIRNPGSSFGLFPNPATGEVSFKAGEDIQKVSLFNLNGSLMRQVLLHSGHQGTINLDDVPAGIYLLQAITTEGKTLNRKLIVQ